MRTAIFLVPFFCFFLIGCNEKVQDKPDDEAVVRTIASLYLDVGGATEIKNRKLLGKHYRPGSDSWQVVTCIDFTLPGDKQISDCNDSFNLFRLDSGKWIVNGQVNGMYRWVEVTIDY